MNNLSKYQKQISMKDLLIYLYEQSRYDKKNLINTEEKLKYFFKVKYSICYIAT